MKNNFIRWFLQLPQEKRTKEKLLACYTMGFCTIIQYKICLKYTIDKDKQMWYNIITVKQKEIGKNEKGNKGIY